MAKIIFTSRYIRNASKAGNLVKYMGTREGVEKLPYGVDHSPSTKKQDDLIASIVKNIPTAADYPEYVEYQQKKEKASATEFIDACVERNSDRIGCLKRGFVLKWRMIPPQPLSISLGNEKQTRKAKHDLM